MRQNNLEFDVVTNRTEGRAPCVWAVIAVAAVIAAVCLLTAGCNDDDNSTSTVNNSTINEAATNSNEIVVSQDGYGNYVQINMETGERTPLDISQIGSNNVVVIDITAPPPPEMPEEELPEL
jgi:outer membrane murein-binding lipoprotein Lpp